MRTVHHITRVAAFAVAALALPHASQAQQDFSNVQIRAHQVSGNIYYLEGQGGNIGLSIGPDGVVMIDDQFAPLTDRILAAIRTLNQGEIRFVINTHIHGDHTGGNDNLGRMGILILAHDHVRVRLAAAGRAREALPVATFSETLTVHLNGEEVHAFKVPPAHTDGDIFIHFRDSDVIHMGDVFRTTGYPFIDLANGGSVDGLIEAIGVAIGLAGPNTKIIPGHGQVSTRADLMRHRDMILDVKARVADMVARGMTYEQIAAQRPTAQYDAGMDNPERFLRALVTNLGGS